MVSKTEYAREWGQSLIIGISMATVALLLFTFGGFDLTTERGRLAVFLFAFAVGLIATYLALFKWKRGTTDLLLSGFS